MKYNYWDYIFDWDPISLLDLNKQ